MPLLLFLLFLCVPLGEIVVFIEVGEWIGVWPTIATVILTALIGTALIRQQGIATLMEAQRKMARNEVPVAEMLHGFFLVIGGILLLIPGFITDAMGFLLLVPAVRHYLAARAVQRMRPIDPNFDESHFSDGEQPDRFTYSADDVSGEARQHAERRSGKGMTIEGHAEEVGPDDETPPRS
ncbi:MAG: FxsA family protein [Parvibaculaceae bacterium]|nr:FxsA family protein [Parvibaculaceae bacterium]